MAPAVAFADRGYHVLVEKPMAVSEDDCRWVDARIENILFASTFDYMRFESTMRWITVPSTFEYM